MAGRDFPSLPHSGDPLEASAEEQLKQATDQSLVIDDGSTQKERMLAGRLYFSIKDKQLASEWNHCQKLLRQYNSCEGMRGQVLF